MMGVIVNQEYTVWWTRGEGNLLKLGKRYTGNMTVEMCGEQRQLGKGMKMHGVDGKIHQYCIGSIFLFESVWRA